MNPRKAIAIADSDFYRVTGERVTMDSVLSDDGVEIVVFLRSFGWPFCQELILQYDGVRDELLADGIGLKMISIGKPEVG